MITSWLTDSTKSETDVPSHICSLCGMDLVFKLKLSNFNLNERSEYYTITQIYVLIKNENAAPHKQRQKGKMLQSNYASNTFSVDSYIIHLLENSSLIIFTYREKKTGRFN